MDVEQSRENWPAALNDGSFPRHQFLRAIERTAPEVLKDLLDTVLPRFRQWAMRRGVILVTSQGALVRAFPVGPLWATLLDDLRPTATEWSSRFNLCPPGGLTGPVTLSDYVHGRAGPGTRGPEQWERPDYGYWMLWVIFTTLARWAEAPPEAGPLSWRTDWVPPRDPPPVLITIPGWDPISESQSTFFTRARAEFETALAAHASYKLKLFTESNLSYNVLGEKVEMGGWPLAPRHLTPKHYDWLVKFQIQGQRWPVIAAAAGEEIHWATIKAGVHKAARAVFGDEFKRWLRRSTVGRPRCT